MIRFFTTFIFLTSILISSLALSSETSNGWSLDSSTVVFLKGVSNSEFELLKCSKKVYLKKGYCLSNEESEYLDFNESKDIYVTGDKVYYVENGRLKIVDTNLKTEISLETIN